MPNIESPGPSPYPEDTDAPTDLLPERLQVVPVKIVDDGAGGDGVRAARGRLVEVIKDVAIELVKEGTKWTIGKAWDVATREPVINYDRPATVYDEASGRVFRWDGDGYVASGGAIAI